MRNSANEKPPYRLFFEGSYALRWYSYLFTHRHIILVNRYGKKADNVKGGAFLPRPTVGAGFPRPKATNTLSVTAIYGGTNI